MGGDIAAWAALRGCTVTLQDRALEYIEPALKRAQELFAKRLRDPAKSAAAGQRLRADVAGEGVADAEENTTGFGVPKLARLKILKNSERN